MNEETDYEDLIAIVETAHGVRLTHEQIDRLNARLDDEERFLVPMSFAEAMEQVGGETRYGTNHVNIRAHVLAVAAELDE